MPKVATKLTDTEIKKAKPVDKEFTLWDGDGLFLRIKPSGKKIWHLAYTVPFTKKRSKMSLGFYPHLTLAQARALRDEYLYESLDLGGQLVFSNCSRRSGYDEC